MKENQIGRGLFIGALVGGVFGTISGLLFAPKPGKEIREDVVTCVGELHSRTIECAKKVGEQTNVFTDKVKSTTAVLVHNVKSLTSNTDANEVEQEEVTYENPGLGI